MAEESYSLQPMPISSQSGMDEEQRPPSEKSETITESSHHLDLQHAVQQASQDPTKTVTRNPIQPDLLNRFHVFCIIANRMIGTGIFDGPSSILRADQNVGGSLILWVLGAVASLAGTLMYVEYGLTIPRLRLDGQVRPVPRSGGELNYFAYLTSRYDFLSTCIFGWVFILIGNSAANCTSFAVHVLAAAGHTSPHPGIIQGIAIGVAWSVLLVHASGRMFGIHLNSIFAMVKVSILLLVIILGFIVLNNHASTMHRESDSYTNFSFKDIGLASGNSGYASAYLSVIFTYGGFNQANYVLGEINRPVRTFRAATLWSVAFISVLYILVNIAYFIVIPIPRGTPLPDDFSVCEQFFISTIGKLWDHSHVKTLMNILLAISSFGNVIVTTFTAARVKQEIAKEGVLPKSLFFAKNINIVAVLKRKFSRNQNKLNQLDLPGTLFEPIPLPALFLHGVFTTFLIAGTLKISKSADMYPFLVGVYSLTIDAMITVLLSMGLIVMRLRRTSNWNTDSLSNWWLSLGAAIIVFIANLFPVIATWVPQFKAQSSSTIPWVAVPVMAWALVISGVLYWVVFRFVVPLFMRGAKLNVTRLPIVLADDEGNYVLQGEQVQQSWEVPEAGPLL